MAAAAVPSRSRCANITPHEKEVLRRLVSAHRDVLDNPKMDGPSLHAKNTAWTEITRQFQIECPTNGRDCKYLRKCYENLRKRSGLGASSKGVHGDQEDASVDLHAASSQNGVAVVPTIAAVTGSLGDELQLFFVETTDVEADTEAAQMTVEQEGHSEALRLLSECTGTPLPRPDIQTKETMQQEESQMGEQSAIMPEDHSYGPSNVSMPEADVAPISAADQEHHSTPGGRPSPRRHVGRLSNLEHTRRRALEARARFLETKTRLLEEKHEKELKILDVKLKQEEAKLQMLRMEIAKRKLR